MKSSDVQLISAFGLILGLIGLVAWYYWIQLVPCVYMESVTHPSCQSLVNQTEVWAVLFALVALILLSSFLLLRSFRAS